MRIAPACEADAPSFAPLIPSMKGNSYRLGTRDTPCEPHYVPLMRSPPSHSEVVAYLRRAFGRENQSSDSLLRWWIHGNGSRNGVALWLKNEPPEGGDCCEVWVTRPDEPKPERCPVTSFGHLDEFIVRVRSVTRESAAIPVHGNVCPPSAPAVA